MGAPKKNEFWKARSSHGRKKILKSPEYLLESANEYFQWCLNNPLMESVVSAGKILELPKMRAMTISGLCIFLGIGVKTFDDYSNSQKDSYKDFSHVTTYIREVLRTQKFEGAAAGFLNANIIARDLGLKDETKTEITVNPFLDLMKDASSNGDK